MRKRGELKQLVLECLGDGRWHRPWQIAASLPFTRRSQFHAYLLRLCRSGLVERALERGTTRYIYRLSGPACRLLLFQQWQKERNRQHSLNSNETSKPILK